MQRLDDNLFVTIHVIDSETGENISGAIFGISDCNCRIVKRETDLEGLIQFRVYPCSKYIIKELIPAENHIISQRTYCILVDRCGNIFINGKVGNLILIQSTPSNPELTEPPILNTPNEFDYVISGYGIPGCNIEVTIGNQTTYFVEAGIEGYWTINMGTTLPLGTEITARQTCPPLSTSNPVTVHVE